MSRGRLGEVTCEIMTLMSWKYHHWKEHRKLRFEYAIRFGKGCCSLFGPVFPLDQARFAGLIDLSGAVYITIIFHSFFGPGPQFRTFFDKKYFVLLWKTYFGGLELKTWLSLYVFCFKCIFFSKLSGDRIRNISRFHQSKEIVVDLSVALPFTISSYNVSSLYLYRRISIENKTWAVFGNSSNNRFIA